MVQLAFAPVLFVEYLEILMIVNLDEGDTHSAAALAGQCEWFAKPEKVFIELARLGQILHVDRDVRHPEDLGTLDRLLREQRRNGQHGRK